MKKSIVTAIFLILSYSSIFAQTDNTFFFFPFYTPDTSVGISLVDMLHFKKPEHKFFSSLNMFAMGTFKNQFVIGMVPSIYFDNQNYLLEGKLIYSAFPKKFYGIGNKTVKDNEEDFLNRKHGFGIALSRKIIKNLMLGVQYDCEDMTIQDTDNDGTLQYIKTNGVVSGFGFKTKFDTRDSNIYPTKGVLIKAEYLLYNNRFGSKYNYSKTDFDFRNYFYVYKKKLLFSYQFFGEFINGSAPIQVMPALGGSNLLRGFYSDRYKDNILLAFQPELKIKITNVVWLALFSGIGNVYYDIEDIDLDKIKTASGMGLRIKIKDNPRMNFRIDYAASNESNGVYFTLMEAF